MILELSNSVSFPAELGNYLFIRILPEVIWEFILNRSHAVSVRRANMAPSRFQGVEPFPMCENRLWARLGQGWDQRIGRRNGLKVPGNSSTLLQELLV